METLHHILGIACHTLGIDYATMLYKALRSKKVT